MSCPPKPAIDRIKKFLVIKNNCWIFTGRTDKFGYGTIKIGGKYGKPHEVHRVVYEHYIGPIPSGLFVCHHCDTPACCNPKHLFLGTAKDNVQDMFRKGRNVRTTGERSGNHKLTSIQVEEIRKDKRKLIEIAKDYGVVKSTISMIKNWKSRKEG